MNQLQQFIRLYFALNPEPSDDQVHALAASINVDHESLEAVIFRMFGKSMKREVLSESKEQLVLEDKYDENTTSYDDLMLNDGTKDASKIKETQEVLKDDGEVIDQVNDEVQEALKDDGVVMPKLQAFARIRATEVDAEMNADHDEDLGGLRKALRHADFEFGFNHHHLHYRSDDPTSDAEDLFSELNKLGYKLMRKPGVMQQERYALKGKDGLVLQRLGTNFRIFYTR